MDPNENLREQRSICRSVHELYSDAPLGTQLPAADLVPMLERLAELVESLDGWIASGGFLPTAWKVAASK